MNMPKRHRGFTLIELLVVVAIISLLVSILMPSLAKVKLLAGNAKCLSNLKQHYMAFIYYAQDNGDRIVDWDGNNNNPTNSIMPYLGVTSKYKGSDVRRCPLAEFSMADEKSYGINHRIGGAKKVETLYTVYPGGDTLMIWADSDAKRVIAKVSEMEFRHPAGEGICNMVMLSGNVKGFPRIEYEYGFTLGFYNDWK